MTTVLDKAIPQTAEELEEALHDPARMKELMGDRETFKAFIKNYAQAFHKVDAGEINKQLREQMDDALKDFLDRNDVSENRLPQAKELLAGGGGLGNGMNHAVYRGLEATNHQKRQIAAYGVGEGMDAGEFSAFNEFARLISPHVTGQSYVDTSRVKVLREGQGDQGGFLVPEEFRTELLMLALESAVVRPRARVLPMNSLTLRVPTIRDTTHASNIHGGVQAYWEPESGSITQTEPSFGQAVLTAKKLVGGTRIANELLADSSIALEPLIASLFSQALAYFEDDAFIAGVGSGQAVGIKNADALVSITKETGQDATTLVVENVIKALSRMLPSSISRSVWIMHPDVKPQLYTMSLAVGTGGAPMFFPAGGITGSPSDTLLGRPIVYSEKCETLGTAGDVYLVDLSYYLIGDRMAMTMASSPHVRFNTDETDFRFIQRVDGRPWIDSALTPRNGSNTLSPFLNIAARS